MIGLFLNLSRIIDALQAEKEAKGKKATPMEVADEPMIQEPQPSKQQTKEPEPPKENQQKKDKQKEKQKQKEVLLLVFFKERDHRGF